MLVRILTLRFDDALGTFDDSPVQELLKDKEVVAIREHFSSALITQRRPQSLTQLGEVPGWK